MPGVASSGGCHHRRRPRLLPAKLLSYALLRFLPKQGVGKESFAGIQLHSFILTLRFQGVFETAQAELEIFHLGMDKVDFLRL